MMAAWDVFDATTDRPFFLDWPGTSYEYHQSSMSMSMSLEYPPSMSISLSSSPVQLAHTTVNTEHNHHHHHHHNNNNNTITTTTTTTTTSNSLGNAPSSAPPAIARTDSIHERGFFQLPPPRTAVRHRNGAHAPSSNHRQNIDAHSINPSNQTSHPRTPPHPVQAHASPAQLQPTGNRRNENPSSANPGTAPTPAFGQHFAFPVSLSPFAAFSSLSPTLPSPHSLAADFNWSPVPGPAQNPSPHPPQNGQHQPQARLQPLSSGQNSPSQTLPGLHHIGLPLTPSNAQTNLVNNNGLNRPDLLPLLGSDFSFGSPYHPSSSSDSIATPPDPQSREPLPSLSNLFPVAASPASNQVAIDSSPSSSSAVEIMPMNTRKRTADAAAAAAAATDEPPATNTRSRATPTAKRRRTSRSQTSASKRRSSQAKHAASKVKEEEEEEEPDEDLVDFVDLVDKEELPEDLPELPDNRVKIAAFQCVICMDDAIGLVVTHCGHLFCTACLQSALRTDATKNKCPICRQMVEVRSRETYNARTKGYWPLELKLMTVTRKGKMPASKG